MPTSIKKLELKNFLSFGPDSPAVELGPLNVIIGPNGAGKSNLIDALTFLSAVPHGFRRAASALNDPASVHWRDDTTAPCTFEVELCTRTNEVWRYELELRASSRRDRHELELVREEIQYLGSRYILGSTEAIDTKTAHLGFRNEPPGRAERGWYRTGPDEPGRAETGPVPGFQHDETVFVQLLDPTDDHGIVRVGEALAGPDVFDSWTFGRQSRLRDPQKTSQPADRTERDWSNFQLVLNRICGEPAVKATLLKYLDSLAPGIEDIGLDTLGGTATLRVTEWGRRVTIDRLSDGTLRTLAILSVFCNPKPPPLIVFEEPELGLHPDMIPTLADLLRSAAERTQVIVTTHSRDLIDCFTSSPEVVLVCEIRDGQTYIEQADAPGFKEILTRKPLGRIWSEGHIGGNRW